MRTAEAFPVPGGFEPRARQRGLEVGGVEFLGNRSQQMRGELHGLHRLGFQSARPCCQHGWFALNFRNVTSVDHLRACPSACPRPWNPGDMLGRGAKGTEAGQAGAAQWVSIAL